MSQLDSTALCAFVSQAEKHASQRGRLVQFALRPEGVDMRLSQGDYYVSHLVPSLVLDRAVSPVGVLETEFSHLGIRLSHYVCGRAVLS